MKQRLIILCFLIAFLSYPQLQAQDNPATIDSAMDLGKESENHPTADYSALDYGNRSPSAYLGCVEITGGLGNTWFEWSQIGITTIHGAKIKDYFVGGGIGFSYRPKMAESLSHNLKIFGNFGYKKTTKTKFNPFLNLSVGTIYITGTSAWRNFVTPGVGCEYNVDSDINVYLKISEEVITKKFFPYIPNGENSINMSLGISF